MSGIKEIIEQEQREERKREIYLEHLINTLVTVIGCKAEYGQLSQIEKDVIIQACNEGGRLKSKYAIKLLELLNK